MEMQAKTAAEEETAGHGNCEARMFFQAVEKPRRTSNAVGRRDGFTMVEVLVVVGIIAVLLMLVMPVLVQARRAAMEVRCKNNLRQLYAALRLYDTDNNVFEENYPARLTFLYPSYIRDPELFVCPFDHTGGKGPGLKPGTPKDTKEDWREGDAAGEKPCSYLYEFSTRQCGTSDDGWWFDWLVLWEYDEDFGWDAFFVWNEDVDRNFDGVISWQEAKFFQLRNGDIYVSGLGFPGDGTIPDDWPDIVDPDYPLMSYPRTTMPIIRCFWHMPPGRIDDQNTKKVLNMALDGNLFNSGPAWEPEAYRNTPKEDFTE